MLEKRGEKLALYNLLTTDSFILIINNHARNIESSEEWKEKSVFYVM